MVNVNFATREVSCKIVYFRKTRIKLKAAEGTDLPDEVEDAGEQP